MVEGRPAASILLVGAGHVFRIEDPIRAIIQGERPSVVALELDPARFQGLLERAKGTYDAKEASRGAPRVYRRLARFQEELAASLGTAVGNEMLAAAQAAAEAGSRLALIDRDAQDLVGSLWREMRWRERMKLAFSTLWARFPGRRGGSLEKELAHYQKDPEAYLEDLGKSYPTLKRVLLDERNEHMAKELRRLASTHGSVVAILGDGHVDGIKRLLGDLGPRVVRLNELRASRPPPGGVQWHYDAHRRGVGFSFKQDWPDEDAKGR